jgi:hypothetical protein
MKHLIITSAIIPEKLCQQKLGYSYEQRISDYKQSFDSALALKDNFDSITIIETYSKTKIPDDIDYWYFSENKKELMNIVTVEQFYNKY